MENEPRISSEFEPQVSIEGSQVSGARRPAGTMNSPETEIAYAIQSEEDTKERVSHLSVRRSETEFYEPSLLMRTISTAMFFVSVVGGAVLLGPESSVYQAP